MINSTDEKDDLLKKDKSTGETNSETNTTKTETKKTPPNEPTIEEKPSKLKTFIGKNKGVFIMLAILIVVLAWALIRMAIMNNKFNKQQTELIQNYEQRIDSINAYNLKTTSEVFAWAIRSELIRQNQDQVNQFFLNYVRRPNVLKINYVDNASSKILISTDKKDEGTQSTGVDIKTDSTFIQLKDSTFNVITPVMGLNSRLGTLIIDYKK